MYYLRSPRRTRLPVRYGCPLLRQALLLLLLLLRLDRAMHNYSDRPHPRKHHRERRQETDQNLGLVSVFSPNCHAASLRRASGRGR